MAMTQTEAIAAVRARLDEPTSVYWTDTDLRRWINDIAKDMARRTECLRATYDQTAVVGDNAYTPTWTSTTGAFRIHDVEFIPDGQTQVYPLEYFDRTAAKMIWGLSQAQTQGIPAIWTSWGAPPTLNVEVYPSPSLAGVLRLWYYRMPTMLSITTIDDAGEQVDIVEGWDDVLVDGVEYKAKMRDRDASWKDAKMEYESHLEAMMEATLKYADTVGQVITPSGLYAPSWLTGGGDWD